MKTPVGMTAQFFPPLVRLVDRIKEGGRIGGVNDDRNP